MACITAPRISSWLLLLLWLLLCCHCVFIHPSVTSVLYKNGWTLDDANHAWYDSECREVRCHTYTLERKYRYRHTSQTLADWRQQFKKQRQLYQRKFAALWLTTVDSCRRTPRELWHAVNNMLQLPKEQPTPKLTSSNFANFFRNKVDNIRESTATAPPPVIVNRHALPLSSFQPVVECEIIKLLHSTPSKSWSLDPIPTVDAPVYVHRSRHLPSVQPIHAIRHLSIPT